MKTKEEILCLTPTIIQDDSKWYGHFGVVIALDEYAQQMSIEFANYRDRFQRMEKEQVKIEQDRVGGIFTWVGVKNEIIYSLFLEELAHPEVLFKMGQYVETSSFYNNIRVDGRVLKMDYNNKTADVIIWTPNSKKEIIKYKFEELTQII